MKSKKKTSSLVLPRKLQNNILWILISLIAAGFYWATDKLTAVDIPESQNPPLLYSTQIRDDLTLTLQAGINQARQSVVLLIYTLTDPKIINALKQKSQEGVSVTVICDGRATPFVDRKLGPDVKVIKRFGDGLMHLKILVVDEDLVWIGSANMTGESLNMHGNLILGFQNAPLGEMILQKAKTLPEEGVGLPFTTREYLMGGQKVEMWFLPDNSQATQKIKSMIANAKKTIRVAMFTWTRMDFAEELVKASDKGIKVTVALDRNAGKGASAKVASYLQKKGIPVHFNQGAGLLHYKLMEIDDQTLVNGSANWTQAAFSKNDDCFIILHDLTPKQKGQMDQLWTSILQNAEKME